MDSSDTGIHAGRSDTIFYSFRKGQIVRLGVEPFLGLTGTVAGHRTEGRVLVQLKPGLFVEVQHFALEPLEPR